MGGLGSGGWPHDRVELTPEERKRLEGLSRQRVAPYQVVVRARALLLAADGKHSREIATTVGVDERTIYKWRKDFLERRLASLRDRRRAGGRRRFSPLGASGGSPHCLPEAGG